MSTNVKRLGPRRVTDAVFRESDDDGLEFASVACSIWRCSGDNDETFEEALLAVELDVEFEHDRLVQIDILQPFTYPAETADGFVTERSVYISVRSAKRFMKGLEKAIAAAEKEMVRRKKKSVRKNIQATKRNLDPMLRPRPTRGERTP